MRPRTGFKPRRGWRGRIRFRDRESFPRSTMSETGRGVRHIAPVRLCRNRRWPARTRESSRRVWRFRLRTKIADAARSANANTT
jgi:hypothetical protein